MKSIPYALSLCSILVLSSGCFDFGYGTDLYDVEPPAVDTSSTSRDGSDTDGGTSGGDCVEGPADPTTDGPQLTYVTLNVDKALLVVSPGDTVTWTNGDTMRHSVVAGAPGAELPPERGGFNSGEFGPGAQWAYRFCDPRTIFYFCGTHPSQMNGYRIVVE